MKTITYHYDPPYHSVDTDLDTDAASPYWSPGRTFALLDPFHNLPVIFGIPS